MKSTFGMRTYHQGHLADGHQDDAEYVSLCEKKLGLQPSYYLYFAGA
jgi:hypothetical protein